MKSIMSRKNQKNFILQSFSEHLRADRFIGFCTGLLVIPIGKPVKSTGFIFSNSIEFGSVFTVRGHTGDDRFLLPYQYFNQEELPF
jgi:hypothetical protein